MALAPGKMGATIRPSPPTKITSPGLESRNSAWRILTTFCWPVVSLNQASKKKTMTPIRVSTAPKTRRKACTSIMCLSSLHQDEGRKTDDGILEQSLGWCYHPACQFGKV